MIFKIKECFFLIFLILLQSCSGGRIGKFLESSFDNKDKIEDIKKEEKSKNVVENKIVVNSERNENNKDVKISTEAPDQNEINKDNTKE